MRADETDVWRTTPTDVGPEVCCDKGVNEDNYYFYQACVKTTLFTYVGTKPDGTECELTTEIRDRDGDVYTTEFGGNEHADRCCEAFLGEETTDVSVRDACATTYTGYVFDDTDFICYGNLIPVHPTCLHCDMAPFVITREETRPYQECCDENISTACEVKTYSWVYTPEDT